VLLISYMIDLSLIVVVFYWYLLLKNSTPLFSRPSY